MTTRRDFLQQSALLAAAPAMSLMPFGWGDDPADTSGRLLVMIELEGGNDGLSMVVPYADDAYRKARTTLRQEERGVVKIADGVGLHTGMRRFADLVNAGEAAIVQGVGYPDSTRSHFRARAVWYTGRTDPEEHGTYGWVGRALDGAGGAKIGPSASLFVGKGAPPIVLRGSRASASSLTNLEDFVLSGGGLVGGRSPGANGDLTDFVKKSVRDAREAAERLEKIQTRAGDASTYPDSEIGQRLGLVSRLIKADLGTRVFYTSQGDYDTHAGQAGSYGGLMFGLGGALDAFWQDMKASKLADRVMVVVWSEFGRTLKENGSRGTDHGTAAPVLAIGQHLEPGLLGTPADLTKLVKHEPVPTTDFRSVWSSVVKHWLGGDPVKALGGKYAAFPLLKG